MKGSQQGLKARIPAVSKESTSGEFTFLREVEQTIYKIKRIRDGVV